MTASYTYLAADLLTNKVLGELPVRSVTFDRQINSVGNWQGSTNMDNPLMDNEDLLACTEPARTALYVYRENQIVWGGIIWSRTYQSQSKSLQITAQTFESYAFKRIYRPPSTVKYNEAQCSIINKLWISLQFDQLYSNIGVLEASSLPANDVTRELTVNPWTMRTYGQLIDDPLLRYPDAAEWTIECYEEHGQPLKRLVVGYPRLGADVSVTNLVIDYPGNILNYFWSESGSKAANAVWATGDGEEGDLTTGFANNPTSFVSGYPLLEIHETHDGVTNQATIDAHAQKDLADSPVPVIGKTIQIKADEQPEFGSYPIGSDAKFQVIDTRFPDDIETVVRVIGWNVTPSRSDAVEEVSLIIEGESAEGGA